jgi:hypothetical protein
MPGYHVELFRYDEQIVEGKRLGRHRLVDSRSAAYPYRAPSVPVVSVAHARHAPIFDQGRIGSCTGNAELGAVATSPLFDALPDNHPVLDEREAVSLYSAATQLDAFPGVYPPSDTGSDGTSVNKAAQAAGLISGYTHAAGIDQVLQALMATPAVFGIDWYDSFDQPDVNGLVTITPNAYVRGGHEIAGRQVDAERKLIGFDNSWSADWGLAGSFWLSWDDVALLLAHGGDCVVPVPLSAPAPVPTPPAPADADVVFASDPQMQSWARAYHRSPGNRYAARTYAAWASQVTAG